jgi:hypothetical protein
LDRFFEDRYWCSGTAACGSRPFSDLRLNFLLSKFSRKGVNLTLAIPAPAFSLRSCRTNDDQNYDPWKWFPTYIVRFVIGILSPSFMSKDHIHRCRIDQIAQFRPSVWFIWFFHDKACAEVLSPIYY